LELFSGIYHSQGQHFETNLEFNTAAVFMVLW